MPARHRPNGKDPQRRRVDHHAHRPRQCPDCLTPRSPRRSRPTRHLCHTPDISSCATTLSGCSFHVGHVLVARQQFRVQINMLEGDCKMKSAVHAAAVSALVLAGGLAALGVASPAHAISGCEWGYTGTSTSSSVWIGTPACTSGALRGKISYYANDNTTKVSTAYTSWISARSSSAVVSRPSGSFYYSTGSYETR
jgi:hypothetical protein